MKKIKITAMILAVVILVTSLNLGIMFTSWAAITVNINKAGDFGLISTACNQNRNSSVTVNLQANIDFGGEVLSSIDATNVQIIFNGNGFVLENFSISGKGLFSVVGENSSFNSLGIYDVYVCDFAASTAGYGLLCGTMPSGTVTKCFAGGTLAVYGTGSYIGGLVGSFGGTMTQSFAFARILTDGSYVGGLIGGYTGSTVDAITNCYSTGEIDNSPVVSTGTPTYNYIGGLIGYSDVSCVANSYTATFIHSAYADTVKAVGCIKDLKSTVYFDETISLQRQEDLDSDHRLSPEEFSSKLTSGWTNVNGHYPYINSNEFTGGKFFDAAVVSTARVDLQNQLHSTGREFTVASELTTYNYAQLGTNSKVTWKITGGVDEYYYDPAGSLVTSPDSMPDGLSGNTLDTRTGKYLFVNTGDVIFTACSGDYEYDITVHVVPYANNPYITGGTGTATDPFIINNLTEFDMIRVYCLDDEIGEYHYDLQLSSVNMPGTSTNTKCKLLDFSAVTSWVPIVGMKGTLTGDTTVIYGLNVTKANEGSAGLFATISATADISNLHIYNAQIDPTVASNAGVLSGKVTDAKISNVMVAGIVTGAENAGMIAGEAYGSTEVNISLTYGQVTGTETAGGIFGTTEDAVKVTDCYSTAVVMGAKTVGGIIATGAGDITTSVFTGMVCPGINGVKYGLTGGSGTITNSYFDWQAAGIHNSGNSAAKMTTDLTTSGGVTLNDNWSWVASGTGGADNYPQLVFFSGNSDALTKRSSNMSALALTYSDTLTEGSSVSFTKVTFNRRYENGQTRNTTAPTVYGTDVKGYKVGTVNTQTQVYPIDKTTGGFQIYQISAAASGYPCDTRYVLFNVKSVNIHYKYTFINTDDSENVIDETVYNEYMSGRGLTDITTELGYVYSPIMDSTVSDYSEFVNITSSGDTLQFVMTHAAKYRYTIKAYADSAETTPIDVQIGNVISIASLDDVYINFEIHTNELPWGNYRISCQ